jgi:hypothetical protein
MNINVLFVFVINGLILIVCSNNVVIGFATRFVFNLSVRPILTASNTDDLL